VSWYSIDHGIFIFATGKTTFDIIEERLEKVRKCISDTYIYLSTIKHQHCVISARERKPPMTITSNLSNIDSVITQLQLLLLNLSMKFFI